jgi:microcystin-dependent protein
MATYTVNAGLVVDPTGSNVGTWADNVTNLDFIALDGLLAGVQTISVASTPVTLTSPAAFTPTPGGGPTQSQNRVLRFTGILTANVTVTLPIPGSYIIENLTTGAFVLSFRGVTATEVIGTPQGERVEIYNDGSNVRFVGLARLGALEMWAGLSAMPAWVTACTVPPYLLCDGTATHTFAVYPNLGARMGSTFGGNGITTFGVPDLRGRVPLAYDGTGTRITTAGCGLNGQTLGASLDTQTVTLTSAQIPAHTHTVTVTDPGHSHTYTARTGNNVGGGGSFGPVDTATPTSTTTNTTGITAAANANTGGGGAHNNVQPSIVTGIWVCKT